VFTALAADTDIQLKIWDGQYEDGAKPIPDVDEDKTGAVTVANKNDTDADTTIDSSDNDVRETRAGAAAHGRDEVDLMKLQAYKPPTYVENTTAKVTVTGPARLWHESWKATAEDGYSSATGEWIFRFDATETFKRTWVEILTESASVGDVVITYEYDGKTDVVFATGIWVPKTDSQFSTLTWAELEGTKWRTDPPENVLDRVQTMGGTGKVPPVNVGDQRHIVNVMMMEFTVAPTDVVQKLPRVQFDVTRSTRWKSWRAAPNDPEVNSEETWPQFWELPNDDTHDGDESSMPDNAGRLYVMDSPGIPIELLGGLGQYFKRWQRANFREWVRVSFDQRPTGEGDDFQGSKASLFVPWHSVIAAERDTFDVWNVMEDYERVIEEGADITIGDNP
jgi:hypothetical protein